MDQAILLMGATATGKTDLAAQLVEKYPFEIISVDSALIYKEMDIGTAKPDAALLQRAPHYLIDFLDPSESWSAWDFVHQARQLISDINQRGNIPLLVGGTMMYFNALQQGLHDLPMADEVTRLELQNQLQKNGLDSLYSELRSIDPVMAEKLKPTDPQRIMRALEVFRLAQKPMSELLAEEVIKPDIDFKKIILDVPDRGALHQRIAQRFQVMLDQGFEEEVIALKGRGDLNPEMPSIRCVGYRQMWMYLNGEYDRSQMVEKSIIATRQLAKRQLTWLRKDMGAARFNYSDYLINDVCQYLS